VNDLPSRRALVVDDDESSAEQVTRILRKQGFAVEYAQDGLEGMRLCQASRFDLIVCDIRMPRISGLTFLSNLKTTQNATTRVVMLSALDDRSIRRQALGNGASAYLIKPVVSADLIEAIALPTLRKPADR
jgi:DNA-binding response OmpR family regulator